MCKGERRFNQLAKGREAFKQIDYVKGRFCESRDEGDGVFNT